MREIRLRIRFSPFLLPLPILRTDGLRALVSLLAILMKFYSVIFYSLNRLMICSSKWNLTALTLPNGSMLKTTPISADSDWVQNGFLCSLRSDCHLVPAKFLYLHPMGPAGDGGISICSAFPAPVGLPCEWNLSVLSCRSLRVLI